MKAVTRCVIGGLAVVLIGATASASFGLADAMAFAGGFNEGSDVTMPSELRPALSVLAANAGFGFFAPRVCSEFRMSARVAFPDSRPVAEVVMKLGPESQMLVSTLTSSAQEDELAKAIATSFASHALTMHPGSSFVEVKLEAEDMPPLSEATTTRAEWITVGTYVFKK